MPNPESFFSELADRLPFEELERAEILEELRGHVADARAGLEAEGLSSDAAARVAIDRLGSPERLSHDLTEARRGRRRLLAAAGAGSWAIVTSGVYGWIIGLLLAVLAWFGTLAVVRYVGPFAFDSISFVAIGVAVYVAGGAVTPVVAARAGYRAQAVRPVLALTGAVLLAGYALVGWSGPLDLVGVVARLSLPAWWVAGTWRTSQVRRGSPRTFGALLVVAIVVMVTTQVVQMRLRDANGAPPNGVAGDRDLGLSRIAGTVPLAIAAVVTGEGSASIAGSSGVAAGTYVVDVSDATRLSGWQDLRVEAWRAVDPGSMSPTPVSPTVSGPFVVATAVWSPPGELPGGLLRWSTSNPWGPRAMTLSGSVRLDATPWMTAAWVALTGVAPDGSRYLLAEPAYVTATFNGTVLDWLEAATAAVQAR